VKTFIRFLIIFLFLALIGIGTLQARAQQPGQATTDELSRDQIMALVTAAHYHTVLSFSGAFEEELHNSTKPQWEEVRPELLKYWSDDMVDGDLQEFYRDHLWDWGYEMGFAFPLWQADMIESVQIISQQPDEVIAEFRAPTDYDITETIRIRLIRKSGSWFIQTQLYGPSV
jgi:hypothetical protein